MSMIKIFGLAVVFGLLGAGFQHGNMHLYNSMVPHVHENGVIHSH